MSEFFTGLSCLFNLVLGLSVALILGWARRHVRTLRLRLEALEAQVALLPRATPALTQDTAAAAPRVAEAVPVQRQPVPVIENAMPVQEPAAASHAVVAPFGGEPPLPADDMPSPSSPSPAPWTQHPLIAWFVQIHLMVQVGVIVLFFGVGFLVKYAVDQGWFPLELRLSAAALLGVGLAVIGWRVRKQQRTYGLALIGGGIGIVYLTTFGAYFFYGLLPASLAFTLFVLLSLLYASMAIANDAPILAFLAMVGAFLAPFLASNGEGSHLVLFSYYAVVNTGVLAIALYKQWPGLNLVSFLFSLLAGSVWAATAYQPAYFGSVELFLALFFGFYLTISLWNGWRTAQRGTESTAIDGILLFANPLATLALQSLLVAGRGYTLAYTAFTVAALYALLSWLGRQRLPDFLSQVFTFFAGFFLLIGVPLRFDAQLTAAGWALQGVGQLWLGVRQRRAWPQWWGTLVQLLAGGAFGLEVIDALSTQPLAYLLPFLNHLYLGALTLSIAAIASATIVRRSTASVHDKITPLTYGLLVLGLGWWYAGGIGQVAFYAHRSDRLALLLLFFAISGVLGEGYGLWVHWRAPRYTLLSVLPAAALLALYLFIAGVHPFADGWYVWPVILVVHLMHLWQWRDKPLRFYHAGGVWLTTFLLTWWAVQQGKVYGLTDAWMALALLGVPLVVLLALGVFYRRLPWLVAAQPQTYGGLAVWPVAGFLCLATLWINQRSTGDSTPLPFVPFFNLLDLLLAAVIWALWQWSRRLQDWVPAAQFVLVDRVSQWLTWGLSFWVLNLAIARAFYHLNAVPFTFTALYNSAIVQTTYALFWGLLALTLMYLAHHRRWRHVWLIGATLLSITIIKLFLVDLANTGSLARIISFIGVGLLTIIVAYFWPAPPRTSHRPQADPV